ncbi:NAD(P)-dependent oxidoreductase [Pseudonocardia sp. KRD291]|uniref:NAD-dependent epimerase/dehydratase family protein n=1 Tax=Pseudonocardia sp. KRD291 TaxID=2792007 RepID=UPI001C4A2C28|nr:NAD(P)-dependent oxidoreductase [Pseudonocardia sp. KRD291]MBW0101542.1 NAD(P)-dependent oxidoreductase [Pseudonocardia sp. KRD291]
MTTSDMTGHRVVVVGGAGYIGSVLVGRLLDAGAHVTVFDQLVYDNGFALHHLLDHDRLTVVRGDLRDTEELGRTAAGADDVVLLASLVGDPVCRAYRELAAQVNRDATIRAIDSLGPLGVARFVFTSTCSNYGVHDPDTPATENSVLNPQSLYARTKIDVEEHVLAGTGDVAGTVLRLATAYGMSPRMRFDLTVSQFARALASDESLLVYDADTWRPYCHVRDISRAIMQVLLAPRQDVDGEVFNVGGNSQQFTKRMIVEELRAQLPEAAVEYRAGDTDPRNYRVCFDKIADRLRFAPEHTVKESLNAVVAAVRAGVFPPAEGPRYGNSEVRHLG